MNGGRRERGLAELMPEGFVLRSGRIGGTAR